MAGTTVSDKSYVARAFQLAFENQDIAIDIEDIKPLMGYKKETAIQRMLEKKEVEYDGELIEEIHADFIDEMLDFYEYSSEVKPAPGAEEVFMQLKEKSIYIALNTGFPREIADVIIDRFQWKEKGLIDDYIASDEVEEGRPTPYMIKELMQRAGVDDAALVAKIGDTEVDVNEGRNAGCGLVVSVTTGAYTRNQLEEYHPDHIIDSLAELPLLIR